VRCGIFSVNRRRLALGGKLNILTKPTIAGDATVGQWVYLVHGTYSAAPDSYAPSWYLDGVELTDGRGADALLMLDMYAGGALTVGEVAHKAGLTDSDLNVSI
jgi:hypothetical protein